MSDKPRPGGRAHKAPAPGNPFGSWSPHVSLKEKPDRSPAAERKLRTARNRAAKRGETPPSDSQD